ncbi:hypothetical protein [Nocardia pseudovaccinii]|uniref:hypothetical protein n=1 Tax=Nocardia pseudovaccinii TaxID=189540 RepID=UPI0007A37FAE|nr:hypothetical protein [Nocardia pseudovaccinii]
MGSEGDGRDSESDRTGSEFGPPLDDFGPPVSEFGPPVGEFGPPTGEQVRPQWSVPEPGTDHPELIWRPADEPPTVPPPPPQYRAPDTTVFGDAPPPPTRRPEPPTRRPEPPVEPDPNEATVRHTTPAAGQRDTWWNSPTESGGVPKPPSEPSGLSWADDPIAKRLAPKLISDTITATPTRHSSRGRWIALGVLAAIVVVLALVVTFVAVSRDGNGSPKAAPPAPPSTSAALSCPASKDGKVTRGNGQGDTSTGPGAILGFQYEFYVGRNGERARRFVAPDAENVSTAEVIQQAINDQIPVGTTHCLRIAESAADTFEVDLTEHRPDGTTNVYRQTIITVVRDGKTVIFAIRERA